MEVWLSERRRTGQSKNCRQSKAIGQSDKREHRIEDDGEQARECNHGFLLLQDFYDASRWRQYGDISASGAY
jgi:hypothetical protein